MAQRFRWIKLLAISFAIAVFFVVGIVHWVNSGDPRSEERSNAADFTLSRLLGPLILLGVIGGVILIIKYAVKSGIQEARGARRIETSQRSISADRGFPVLVGESKIFAGSDGPGQYRVQGVHRQTKMDISKYIQADSAANAQVKAELEDIVVTSVTKVVL